MYSYFSDIHTRVRQALVYIIGFIAVSCVNDTLIEDDAATTQRTIQMSVDCIAGMDTLSPVNKAPFAFEGNTAFPRLKLDGTDIQGTAVIRNENSLIPVTTLPLVWKVDAANRKLYAVIENFTISYPETATPGKWSIAHILYGAPEEGSHRIAFQSQTDLAEARHDETAEVEVPFVSDWKEIDPMNPESHYFHFSPQGTFYRYAIRNNTGTDLPVASVRLSGKDRETLANPFAIRGYYDLARLGGNASPAADFQQTWICNDPSDDINTDAKGNKLARNITLNLSSPEGIMVKAREVSPFFPMWVMPVSSLAPDMAAQINTYTTRVFVSPPADTDLSALPYWAGALYKTPVAEIKSSSFPKNGKTYTRYINLKKPEITLRNWMAELPDNRPLYKMSIPGTHDSAADKGFGWAKCQSLSIKEQLENGIRFLDLRVSLDDGKLQLRHGAVALGKNLQTDVLAVVRDFLIENPSETVLMTIKIENQTYTQAFSDRLQEELYGDSTISRLMAGKYHSNITLGEIRGKILAISRNREFTTNSGYVYTWFDNQTFDNGIKHGDNVQGLIHVEDLYKAKAATKIEEVKKFIVSANDACNSETQVLHLGFTSNTGPLGAAWPSVQAGYIDPEVLKYINSYEGLKSCGILIYNFAEKDGDLTKAIVKLNSK